MRKIGEKYYIDGDKIIKTSTGEEISETEPIIFFRGRDRLALPVLVFYRQLCVDDGATEYHLEGMDQLIAEFQKWADEKPTKQPGITRGAKWDGTQS